MALRSRLTTGLPLSIQSPGGRRGAAGPSRTPPAEHLASADATSLRLAAEAGARTVTVPAISTGVYGYPLDAAARVAVRTVAGALAADSTVERATFVLFSADSLEAFRRALDEPGEGVRGDLQGRG